MEKVTNPVDEAAKNVFITKLNSSHKETTNNRQNEYMGLNFTLPSIAKNTKSKIAMNKVMMELHPDIQLCSDILTSSILASNDMMTYNLIYSIGDIKIPMDVSNAITTAVEEHIEENYFLTKRLKDITKESLVDLGAYIEVVIPEAALDEVINSKYDSQGKELSNETYEKNLSTLNQSMGLLNSNDNIVISRYTNSASNESLTHSFESNGNSDVEFTDDLSILSIKLLKKEVNTKQLNPSLSKYFGKAGQVSMEDINSLDEITENFRNNDNDGKIDLIKINNFKSTKRKSIGRPLTMKVPMESIIPITMGGDTSNHIFYIMLLNSETGNPLEISEDEYKSLNSSNVITNIGNTNTVSGDAVNSVLNKAISSMSITNNSVKTDELEAVYSNILNDIILNKLKNNNFTQADEININSSFYKVMLARSLKAKKTKMLFLPKELVQYYAFEYDSNGIGVSKLEKLQMLFSLKSILLLSRVNSTIKNSIPITKVTGKLEEFDPQPLKTMEKIKSQVIAARQNLVPLGMIDAKDISTWLHQSGIVMQLSHPMIPDMELNVSDENRNLVTPDGDLETKIDEKIYMGMSLTPEIVAAGYSTDYATTVTAKNLLMAKRISEYQETLVGMLSNNLKIYLSCDATLQEKIDKIIEKNLDIIKKRYEEILQDVNIDDEDKERYTKLLSNDEIIKGYLINSIIKKSNIKLPTIDMVEAPALKNAFNDYKETLDSYIELILPDSVLSVGLGEEVGAKLSVIRDIVKSTLMRKFMSDNNYIPELADMLTTDSDGKPKINLLSEFNTMMKPLGEALVGYFKDEDGVRKIISEAYKNAGIEDTGGSGDYGDDTGGSGDDGSGGGYGDSGFDDGSGDNTGGNDEGDNLDGGDNLDIDTGKEGDGGLNFEEDEEEDPEADTKVADKADEKPEEKEEFDNKADVKDEESDVVKEDETKDEDKVDDKKDTKDSDEKTNRFKKNHTI